ncbi:MAG: hypothetical protein AB7O24_28620 [Kofleriaceae bacterium]
MADDTFKLGASSMRGAMPKRQTGPFTVEVVGDDLTIDLRPATLARRVLDVIAKRMREKLTAAGWRVTGTLIDSIKVVGETITASADRLRRDPKLAEKFAQVVGNPLDDAEVKASIEDMVAKDMIDVKKGRR